MPLRISIFFSKIFFCSFEFVQKNREERPGVVRKAALVADFVMVCQSGEMKQERGSENSPEFEEIYCAGMKISFCRWLPGSDGQFRR